MGHVSDQLRLHPLGFQLLLGCHHGNIRQAVQFICKFPESADQHLVVHLGVQIALAHPLGALQQDAEGTGCIEDHTEENAESNENIAHLVGADHDIQEDHQGEADQQELPGQRQHGKESSQNPAQPVTGLQDPAAQPYRSLSQLQTEKLHKLPQSFGQTDHQRLQLFVDELPQPAAQSYQLVPQPGDQLQTSSAKGISPEITAGCLDLSRKGEAETHKQKTGSVGTQGHEEYAGLSIFPNQIPAAFHDTDAAARNTARGSSQIQVNGDAVQAAGPHLLGARLPACCTAQVDCSHGKTQQAGDQHRDQVISQIVQILHQQPFVLILQGNGPHGNFHGIGGGGFVGVFHHNLVPDGTVIVAKDPQGILLYRPVIGADHLCRGHYRLRCVLRIEGIGGFGGGSFFRHDRLRHFGCGSFRSFRRFFRGIHRSTLVGRGRYFAGFGDGFFTIQQDPAICCLTPFLTVKHLGIQNFYEDTGFENRYNGGILTGCNTHIGGFSDQLAHIGGGSFRSLFHGRSCCDTVGDGTKYQVTAFVIGEVADGLPFAHPGTGFISFVKDPTFLIAHKDIAGLGRLRENKILPVLGGEDHIAAAVMGSQTQTVIRTADGQHFVAALQPQIHLINRIAPGRHIVVYIDFRPRFCRSAFRTGGFPTAEHQGIVFQGKPAHTVCICSLINLIAHFIAETDLHQPLAAQVQQARIIGGEHHIAIFVITQKTDVRHAAHGFFMAVRVFHINSRYILPFRRDGIIDAAHLQWCILQVGEQDIGRIRTELLQKSCRIAGIQHHDPIGIRQDHTDHRHAQLQIFDQRLGRRGIQIVIQLQFQLLLGCLAQTGNRFAANAVFSTGTVRIGHKNLANITAILRNCVVDMVIYLHLRRHGHGQLCNQVVLFLVLVLGHFVQDVDIAGTGGHDLIDRSIFLRFGGYRRQHIPRFIPDHISDLIPVKGIVQPVVSVILAHQALIRTAQLPGSITHHQLVGQIVCRGFQGIGVGFLQGLIPQPQLRYSKQAQAAAHTRQQGGRAEENRKKFENDMMLQLFSSFHFVALAPDHFQIPGFGGIDLDLFPQVADVDGNGTFAAQSRLLPDGFIEGLGGKHLAGILHQQMQNGIFRGSQGYGLTLHQYGLGTVIQGDSADGQFVLGCQRPGTQLGIAAQLAADSRQHLHGNKGLGDVIIGTYVQAQHLILCLRLGSQKNNGGIGQLPDLGGGGNAVHDRHHNIQQNQVDIMLFYDFQGFRTGESFKKLVPLRCQIDFQRIHNIRLVITDQNVVHGGLPPYPFFLGLLYHHNS